MTTIQITTELYAEMYTYPNVSPELSVESFFTRGDSHLVGDGTLTFKFAGKEFTIDHGQLEQILRRCGFEASIKKCEDYCYE